MEPRPQQTGPSLSPLGPDVLSGKSEWLNVPEIVRLTLHSLYNTIQTQAVLLQTLTHQYQTVSAASSADLRKLSVEVTEKFTEHTVILKQKADRDDAQSRFSNMDRRLSDVERDKLGADALHQSELRLHDRIANLVQAKVDASTIDGRLSDLDRRLSGHTEQLQQLHADTRLQYNELQQQQQKLQQSVAAVKAELDLKPSRAEVAKLLSTKVDTSDSKMAHRHEFDKLRESQAFLLDALRDKADLNDVKQALITIREEILDRVGKQEATATQRLESMTQSLAVKVNTGDIGTLVTNAVADDFSRVVTILDNKADAALVASLQQALQTHYTPLEEFSRHTAQQARINMILCSETAIGRWIWKSGHTERGYTVPWNVESINTDRKNFLWEENTLTIITVAPGLYEINAGFFTHGRAVVSVLANDIPVLSCEKQQSTFVLPSSLSIASSVTAIAAAVPPAVGGIPGPPSTSMGSNFRPNGSAGGGAGGGQSNKPAVKGNVTVKKSGSSSHGTSSSSSSGHSSAGLNNSIRSISHRDNSKQPNPHAPDPNNTHTSNRPPDLSFVINGSTSTNLMGTSGTGSVSHVHPSGNISGLSVRDFLALPAHARIELTFNGPDQTQGFLSLKKL